MSIVRWKDLRCLHVLMVCFLVSGLQTARAQPLTTVTGVVLDGVTNAPIADVDVVSGQRTVVTGSDGRFSIAVDTETSELRFKADGYLDSVAPLVRGDLEIRLFSSRFAETVEVPFAGGAGFVALAPEHLGESHDIFAKRDVVVRDRCSLRVSPAD